MSTELEKLERMLPGYAQIKITENEATIHLETTRHYNSVAVQRAISLLLKGLGVEHIEDPNFSGTAKRVEKMYREWLAPKDLKLATFPSNSGGAVTLIGHTATSMCPHHLLPFHVRVDLAYIPQGFVVGLSKLSRLVDLVAASFVLQEHIGEFVVGLLDALLLPRGAICRVRGSHGCMRLRGVKTDGEIATTALRGVFLTDEKARSEFLMEAMR
jgi:GTP cyclohydrolase I